MYPNLRFLSFLAIDFGDYFFYFWFGQYIQQEKICRKTSTSQEGSGQIPIFFCRSECNRVNWSKAWWRHPSPQQLKSYKHSKMATIFLEKINHMIPFFVCLFCCHKSEKMYDDRMWLIICQVYHFPFKFSCCVKYVVYLITYI